MPRLAVYRAHDKIVVVDQMRIVLRAHPLQEVIQFIACGQSVGHSDRRSESFASFSHRPLYRTASAGI